MSDQQTFLSRIGNWFRNGGRNGDLPLTQETAIEPRSTFLRPWGGQRAAPFSDPEIEPPREHRTHAAADLRRRPFAARRPA